MKKENNKILVLTVVVCLLPILLGIALYNQLPEQIPIHFSMDGVADGYASKNFTLFGIPIIMAVIQAIFMFATIYQLKAKEKPKVLKIAEWIFPILTILIYIDIILSSLEIYIYSKKIIFLIIGILFIIMGIYFPKMNYDDCKNLFHPTPSDEREFREATKIARYVLIGMGLLFIILIICI